MFYIDVYRGHSTSRSSPRQGFQAWGRGQRFACVPTKEGVMWYAAVANGKGGQVVEVTAPYEEATLGALRNASRVIREDERHHLLSLFQDYHDPIPSIMSCSEAAAEGITVCEGVASANTTPASSTSTTPIVYLGDAYHVHDPILAVGTGVAIEDAFLLSQSLQQVDLNVNGSLSETLAKYNHTRQKRIETLHFLSNLSQTFGHVESQLGCTIRDWVLLHVVPQAVAGRLFDFMISKSIESEVYKV